MKERRSTSPGHVRTVVLARELGVTERRVNQLVAEHVLPAPRDGRHDAALARSRYDLFRRGTAEEWLDFLRDLEDEARKVERMSDEACEPAASQEQLTAASVALQKLVASLRFFAACRVPEGLRDISMAHLQQQEDEGLRRLLGRAAEILGARAGISRDQVLARIRAEPAA